jgi:transposase
MGSDDGRHHRRTPRRHPDDRQHFGSCPPTGCDGKKGGRRRRSLPGSLPRRAHDQNPRGRRCARAPDQARPTTGQAHDGQIADTLLNQLGPHTIVLADKAYDADRIRQLIQDHGATPNIPPKSNRRWKPCFSRRLYRERNLIERFFSKLKHFRRVATRYDKLAANFLAMVQLASMRLWMRANEPTG